VKWHKTLFTRPRKLLIDIVFLFFLFFLLACGSIISFTYHTYSRSTIEFAYKLIAETEGNIIDKVVNDLKPSSTIIELTDYLVKHKTLHLSDKHQLYLFMHHILRFQPSIASIYFADNQGNFFQETRIIKGSQYTAKMHGKLPKQTKYITYILDHSSDKLTQQILYKSASGSLLLARKNVKLDFDPRTRLWFVGAKHHPEKLWFGTYRFFDINEDGLTISRPVFSANNKMVGVLAMDFTLAEIQRFLVKTDLSKGSVIFIVNNKGDLISTSDAKARKIIAKNKIKDPRITQAYAKYEQVNKERFIFSVGNKTYIAEFSHFAKEIGGSWTMGIVVPINYYIGALKRTNLIVTFFSILLMLLGIAAIVFIARKISRPIMYLAKEASKIKNLEFAEPIKLDTHIMEVQTMLDAMNDMKVGLASFAKYVPDKIVRELIKTGEIAKLGSEEREITLLFSDINDFTSIVETSAPDAISAQLIEYLEVLSKIITAHHGTIDKFIGDAIMSFWNAPIRNEEHVSLACRTALLCKKKMDELNRQWQANNKPVFITRFGLHTGKALVGNIGAADRINYTAIGDNVNLAARLDNINKLYATQILVSDAIIKIAGNQFLFRIIDEVKVKGKQQSTILYELVAGNEQDVELRPTEDEIDLCYLTNKAYSLYYQKEWDESLKVYQRIYAKYPDDQVAELFIKRCEKQILNH